MKLMLVKYFVLVMIVLGQAEECIGKDGYCIEEKRVALLELKDFLTENSYDHLLPSWVMDDRESHCCGWERVSCNPVTGHVTELLLNDVRKVSPLDAYWQPLLLNASLFLPFHELVRLDLSENIFNCCMENEGLDRLANLKKLEMLNFADNILNDNLKSVGVLISLKTLNLSGSVLDLGSLPLQELSTLRNLEILDLSACNFNSSLPLEGYEMLSKLSKLEHLELSKNYFDKGIFRFLSVLPGLKYLALEENEMEGPLSNRELLNLSSTLEVLSLRDNKLNGTLPIKELNDFRNLEILDLSLNSFVGSIPRSIEALHSLKALSLYDNQLNGSLPIPGLCKLKNLQELDISKNSFEGSLPKCLINLTSLTVFDVSYNHFSGSISPSLMSKLRFLEYIDIKLNNFEGTFDLSTFANHSRLQFVELGYNKKLEVETESSYWIPKFQLKLLALQHCNLNKQTQEIPTFLLQQHKLEVVDLSHNNLTGKFPSWLLEKTTLYVLNLRNNSFYGQIRLPLSPLTNLVWMDVSNNHFNGQLEKNAGKMLPNLTYLNLSRNGFEGVIPPSICYMSRLDRLDLSFNNFSGEVPTRFIGGCCTNLLILKLSNNNFDGSILSSHFNMTDLAILQLNDNRFSGALSNAFSKISRLVKLDIGNNYMSGVLPTGIGNMTIMESVIMRENFFKGQLPSDLPHALFLDLSINKFSGVLPSEIDKQVLEHLHLQGNQFTGPIPEAYLNSSSLLTLDIRDNSLSGDIPIAISDLSNLRVLLLSGNLLSGEIPIQLCQLKKLSLLDLSYNSLHGSIPHCFSNIAFGVLSASEGAFTVKDLITWYAPAIGTYGSLIVRILHIHDTDDVYNEQDEIEFVTKSRPSLYKGDILNFMSGMDLSCNNLTGEIPSELGELGWIHALNLSHNHLVGSIPKTFSKLKQIESLDLSHNTLSGQIPSELIYLNFLEVFSVSYNNLSGRIPDRKAQFGTFENSSYEGNPLLCGPPLEKKCNNDDNDSPPSQGAGPEETDGGKWYEIDLLHFFASFSAAYLIFFIGIITILYINPYWRWRLVDRTVDFLYSCYYSVSDVLHKLPACF